MHKKKSENFNHPEWSIGNYDITRDFIELNGTFPNNTNFSSSNFREGYISYNRLIKQIEKLGGELIYQSNIYNLGVKTVYYKIGKTYFLLEDIGYESVDTFDALNDDEKGEAMVCIVGHLITLHVETSLSEDLLKSIKECLISTINVPMIGIISRNNNGFFLNEIKMESKFSSELDLHYGTNFTKFHEKLLDKLSNSNKGLTLFHGEPGTGKSSYIRKLIYDLKQLTNKKIIIVPNNLIAFLVDPEFNTFLLETIESYQYDYYEDFEDNDEEETSGLILILEDAESVLMKRETGDNNQGTSNILNLTDGLLNDIFNIQIISTYNTVDDNIDPAIMRSKRLIAKKNFRKLNIEQSKNLAKFIGVDESITINESKSVAEIYSLLDKETEDILIERTDIKKNVGFNI